MQPSTGDDGSTAARNQYKKRSLFFKMAFGIMTTAAIVLTFGFGYPDWSGDWSGLWFFYYGGQYYKNTGIVAGDVNAVRAMECLALTSAWGSVITELYQDVFSKKHAPTSNMAVEILAVLAGILGLTGALVFGVRRPCLVDCSLLQASASEFPTFCNHTMTVQTTGCDLQHHLAWAFLLSTMSSGFLLVSALVIFIARRQSNKSPVVSPNQTRWKRASSEFGSTQQHAIPNPESRGFGPAQPQAILNPASSGPASMQPHATSNPALSRFSSTQPQATAPPPSTYSLPGGQLWVPNSGTQPPLGQTQAPRSDTHPPIGQPRPQQSDTALPPSGQPRTSQSGTQPPPRREMLVRDDRQHDIYYSIPLTPITSSDNAMSQIPDISYRIPLTPLSSNVTLRTPASKKNVTSRIPAYYVLNERVVTPVFR